ncbi:rta1 domain-containing protein [Colletotrichum truncatum]|uniref:Rta1 domain-containing protein n=1 Tax=Colletotrichum truncatum TaxID=5467 RepID=A0ACC3YRM6_COLTU|nr:rta1 domain-containing protein [Colletotrichum truncatum]KAF6799303.1 rta1 domain-containing protein [Colletotrichum truncatum]
MAILEPYKHGYYLWKYIPSIEAAATFCALFIIATGAICHQMIRNRAWFSIPLTVGGYMEVVGFACRAAAHNKTGKLMPYVIQQNNILLAPVLFAATIYMTLGRIIRNTGEENLSFIRPKRITRLFVTGDILSLAIQGGAAGLMVVGTHNQLAQAMVLTGLFLQIILFGIFCALAFVFDRRLRRYSTTVGLGDLQWDNMLRMLYVVCGLVMLRSIFRVVEYIMGVDGYLLSHEWPLYVFDAVPMLTVMFAFWRWFPTAAHRPTSLSSGTSMEILGPTK